MVLSQALTQCENLQTLNFGYNNLSILDANCFTTLCQVFQQCINLRVLNLSSKNLGKLDAKRFAILCQALAQCKNLQILNLNTSNLNGLNTACFSTLRKSITQCTSLHTLYLGCNSLCEIEAQCFFELCQTFAECQGLEALYLEYNNLYELNADRFTIFYKALSNCEILTVINDIEDFKEEEQKILLEMLNRNKTFIDNIQQTLSDALPSAQVPTSVQEVIMHYIAPSHVFPKISNTAAGNVQDKNQGMPASDNIPAVTVHFSHEKTAASPLKNSQAGGNHFELNY